MLILENHDHLPTQGLGPVSSLLLHTNTRFGKYKHDFKPKQPEREAIEGSNPLTAFRSHSFLFADAQFEPKV